MSINTLIKRLLQLRDELHEVTQREQTLKQDYDETKLELITLLNEQELSSVNTPEGRATITQQEVIQVVDWDFFYDYIKKNDAFFLLQKRPAINACKELATLEGFPIPGTCQITTQNLSLTTTPKR